MHDTDDPFNHVGYRTSAKGGAGSNAVGCPEELMLEVCRYAGILG